MTRLADFSRKTKVAAWERADGRCEHEEFRRGQLLRDNGDFIRERCNKKLFPGDIFYDHIIPEAISHDNSLANCQVLCRDHHDAKTRKADVPTIAKVKRVQANHIGAKVKRPASKYKRRMDGKVVYRETGELVRPR